MLRHGKTFPATPRPRFFFRTKKGELQKSKPLYSTTLQKMRPLTEEETQTLFAKLANYTGNSLKNLIAPLGTGPNADRHVFRLHQSRCYYVRLSLANLATSISRDKLLSLGTCLGMPVFAYKGQI